MRRLWRGKRKADEFSWLPGTCNQQDSIRAIILIAGILAGRLLASIVYEATPRDPMVLAGVVLAMVLVGVLATWIPAQRALALDPMKLLREE